MSEPSYKAGRCVIQTPDHEAVVDVPLPYEVILEAGQDGVFARIQGEETFQVLHIGPGGEEIQGYKQGDSITIPVKVVRREVVMPAAMPVVPSVPAPAPVRQPKPASPQNAAQVDERIARIAFNLNAARESERQLRETNARLGRELAEAQRRAGDDRRRREEVELRLGDALTRIGQLEAELRSGTTSVQAAPTPPTPPPAPPSEPLVERKVTPEAKARAPKPVPKPKTGKVVRPKEKRPVEKTSTPLPVTLTDEDKKALEKKGIRDLDGYVRLPKSKREEINGLLSLSGSVALAVAMLPSRN